VGLGSLSLDLELLSLIDTVLLKVYLRTDPGALTAFLEAPQWCDIGEATAALRADGRYSELVQLYRARALHASALELLHVLARAEGSGVPRSLLGTAASVRYLNSLLNQTPLTAATVDLVLARSLWVLASDHGEALDIFLPARPSEDLDRARRALDGDWEEDEDEDEDASESAAAADDVPPADADAVSRSRAASASASAAPGVGAGGGGSPPATIAYPAPVALRILRHLQQHTDAAVSGTFIERLIAAGASAPELHDEYVALCLQELAAEAEQAGLPRDLQWFDTVRAAATSAGRSDGGAGGGGPAVLECSAGDGDDDGDDGDDNDGGLGGRSALGSISRRVSEAVTASAVPARLHIVYGNLLAFLSTSARYDAARALALLPPAGLTEARVALLARLGRHREVLVALVRGLGRLQRAEEYCDTVAAQAGEQAPQVYHYLLELYLSAASEAATAANATPSATGGAVAVSGPARAGLDAALRLLMRCHDRVDLAGVVARLPANTPLYILEPFLVRIVSGSLHRVRSQQITKNLLKSEYLHVQHKLYEESRGRVIVDRDTQCRACRKKIGLAAFALSPQKDVYHYVCYRAPEATEEGNN
jgi:hypothetical protein